MHPSAEEHFNSLKKWQIELKELRRIILDCLLTEEWKWKQPCYTFNTKNVLILGAFKEYCGVMFFKGALLSDTKGILFQQTENVQSSRIIKIKSIEEVLKLEHEIKAYVFEAIEIEKRGLKVDFKKTDDNIFTEELRKKLDADKKLKQAFEALSPGRQKAYHLFFSAAKQSTTREARIEKYVKRILSGKGINDCVCGLSKKMPNCDGSHKFLKKVD